MADRIVFAAQLVLLSSCISLGLLNSAFGQTAEGPETTTRFRIAWGGGALSSWEGRISVRGGHLSNPTPLGIEADSPGSIWLDGDVLRIERRGLRGYDGVDLTVSAPKNALLTVILSSGNGNRPVSAEFQVQRIRSQSARTDLDERGNYLLVDRAPGDALRIKTPKGRMIFEPGELLPVELELDLADSPAENHVEIQVVVKHARTGEASWSNKWVAPSADDGPPRLAVEIPLPKTEGAYNIHWTAVVPVGFVPRWVPGATNGVLTERELQVVVFDSSRFGSTTSGSWHDVAVIDATNPTWWDRLPKWMRIEQIPGFSRAILTNASTTVRDLAEGQFLEIPARRIREEPSWWAVSLPVEEPHIPHMIEIEVAGGTPHDLGVTILEPNAAGKVVPISRDFGFHRHAVPSSPKADPISTCRLIYWPRTSAPLLLVTNLHRKEVAQIGRIRVRSRHGRLARPRNMAIGLQRSRLAAGSFARPLVPEAFGVSDVRDPKTGQTFDDWQSFFDASERMSQFLQFAGYNAAVVSVMSDGAAIYPSRLTDATLLYDAGLLSSLAQDPVRKDCLELFMRSFDRASLALVPSLELNAPLPAIESKRRLADPQVAGLESIGADGRVFREYRRSRRPKTPRYNLLNRDVQDAILEIVREITNRYGQHPAFVGLALDLSDQAFTQLPGIAWGFDDTTIGRFEKATGIEVPGTGPNRFRDRATYLLGKGRNRWADWRTAEITAFYRRVRNEIATTNPARSLYLVMARTLDRPSLHRDLRPMLSPQLSVRRQLLDFGLDWSALGKISGIVLIRPYYSTPPVGSLEGSFDVRLNHSVEIDQQLADATRVGIQLHQRSRRIRLGSFDVQSPFGQATTFTSIATQTAATGAEARRNMIRAIATHDASILMCGGQMLSTSFDPDARKLLDVFQQLPSPDSLAAVKTIQPITVRTYDEPNATVVCVLNDSPWPIRVSLPLRAHAGCSMIEFASDGRPRTVPTNSDSMNWQIDLAPYALRAARFSEPNVRIIDFVLQIDDEIQTELAKMIDNLGERAATMRRKRAFRTIDNADFEQPGAGAKIPGWNLVAAPKTSSFRVDVEDPKKGDSSGRLETTGPSASLQSDPFPAPETGRLTMWVWIRAEAPNSTTRVHLVLEDADDPHAFRQHAVLGANQGQPLSREWIQYSFPVDRLPANLDARLRLRFDLIGNGTIWIDNIELFDLDLVKLQQRDESVELFKIIYTARTALDAKHYSDCLRILDGYWPTFLREHVRLDTEEAMQMVEEPKPPKKNEDVADRLKGLVPKFLRK